MYTCKDFDCLIGLAVDGLLDGPDKAALEQHLTECADCRRKLADLTAIRAELARPVETPADLHNKIMGAVAAHQRQRDLRRMMKKVGSAAAVLVLCLTVAGGLDLLGSGLLGAKSADEAFDMAVNASSAAADSCDPVSTGGAAFYNSTQDALKAEISKEPAAAPDVAPAPMPEPNLAPQAPVAQGLHRQLLAGDGIAFAGIYAFNLIVEGDPEEIKKILSAEAADETAPGYRILQVSADYDKVCEQLKLAGCSFLEDARNGMTDQGTKPEHGLVSVKLK